MAAQASRADMPRARAQRARAPRVETLREGRALGFRSDACLNAVRADYGCDVCVGACPADALAVSGFGVALGESCLDCGLCVAACPTGALDLPALAVPDAGAPIRLDCSRAEPETGVTQVPCLGALGVERLLESMVPGAAPLTLLDRGLCGTCPLSGGDPAPWAAAIAEAAALAAEAGAHPATPPRVEAAARPRRSVREAPENPARRALFRRVTTPEPAPPPTWARVGKIAAPARARRLAALAALAPAPPAAAFPVAAATEACRLHGLCAAVCPTGALALGQDAGRLVLAFDAARCIGCGDCAPVCPEGALSIDVSAAGRVAAPEGPEILAARASRDCADCGRAFTPDAGEATCPACARSTSLIRETVGLFGRAGPLISAAPLDPSASPQPERTTP